MAIEMRNVFEAGSDAQMRGAWYFHVHLSTEHGFIPPGPERETAYEQWRADYIREHFGLCKAAPAPEDWPIDCLHCDYLILFEDLSAENFLSWMEEVHPTRLAEARAFLEGKQKGERWRDN